MFKGNFNGSNGMNRTKVTLGRFLGTIEQKGSDLQDRLSKEGKSVNTDPAEWENSLVKLVSKWENVKPKEIFQRKYNEKFLTKMLEEVVTD